MLLITSSSVLLKLVKVKEHMIISALFTGAYVPLTTEGNIMVNGVLASCYPSADHDLAHFAMIPIQWFPGTIEWIFGEENGFQGYVTIIEEFGRWMLPKSLMY